MFVMTQRQSVEELLYVQNSDTSNLYVGICRGVGVTFAVDIACLFLVVQCEQSFVIKNYIRLI